MDKVICQLRIVAEIQGIHGESLTPTLRTFGKRRVSRRGRTGEAAAVGNAQLSEHRRNVTFDGASRDEQRLSDLHVGHVLAEQREDLGLALGDGRALQLEDHDRSSLSSVSRGWR